MAVGDKRTVLDMIKDVDDNDSGINATTVQGVSKDLLGIGGDGYAWVEETANRALGTTYANTTGKPILISIYIDGVDGNYNQRILIDGKSIINSLANDTGYAAFYCLVSANSTYKVSTNNGDGSISHWYELK